MVAGEYETAYQTYQTAYSLNPNDVQLPPRIENTEHKVRSMQMKRQGIDQMEVKDFGTAVSSFDSALELWPEHDHEEIRLLREEAERKRRALELKRNYAINLP